MKKLLFILVALAMMGCRAKKAPVKVDPLLYEAVQEFVYEGEKQGIDTNVMVDSLSYIVVLPLDDNLYGIYTTSNRQISINVDFIRDPYIVRKVIFHELGHVFGLPHAEVGIMSTNENPDVVHNRYCPQDNPAGDANWELHKIMFYREILKVQKNK